MYAEAAWLLNVRGSDVPCCPVLQVREREIKIYRYRCRHMYIDRWMYRWMYFIYI